MKSRAGREKGNLSKDQRWREGVVGVAGAAAEGIGGNRRSATHFRKDDRPFEGEINGTNGVLAAIAKATGVVAGKIRSSAFSKGRFTRSSSRRPQAKT
jgi:hypothetical protein